MVNHHQNHHLGRKKIDFSQASKKQNPSFEPYCYMGKTKICCKYLVGGFGVFAFQYKFPETTGYFFGTIFSGRVDVCIPL